MTTRPRSRSRSPLRSSSGIMERDRRGSRERNGSSSGGGRGNQSDRMVFISNLTYDTTWMELKNIVTEKAGEVNFVETIENRDGRSKGCAVVEFKTREAAEKCVDSMHRTDCKGRMIVCKEIRDPAAFFRKVKEDTGIDFLSGGGRETRERPVRPLRLDPMVDENETYGLSPAFLTKLNIKMPLVNRIFITNISYNCGCGRLFDVCSLAGKVTWFDLQLDKEGKSKGMAVCQYTHPIEAVQAVSMLHDQRLFDRTISVKMDRFDKDPSTERREGELPVGLRGIGMGLGAGGAPLKDVSLVVVPTQMNGGGGGGMMNPFGSTPVINPFSAPYQPQPQQIQYVQQQQPQQPQSYAQAQLAATQLAAASIQQQQQPAQQQQQAVPASYYSTPVQQQQPAVAVAQQQQPPQNGSQYFNQTKPTQVPQAVPAPVPKPEAATPYATSGAYGGAAPQQQQVYGGAGVPAGVGQPAGGGYGGGGGVFGGGMDSVQQTSSRVILIKNLPLDYTWNIVSDRVQQFGDLENVEMISQGVAKVRFIQLPDAERAKASLHGTTVEGRTIAVEYL